MSEMERKNRKTAVNLLPLLAVSIFITAIEVGAISNRLKSRDNDATHFINQNSVIFIGVMPNFSNAFFY